MDYVDNAPFGHRLRMSRRRGLVRLRAVYCVQTLQVILLLSFRKSHFTADNKQQLQLDVVKKAKNRYILIIWFSGREKLPHILKNLLLSFSSFSLEKRKTENKKDKKNRKIENIKIESCTTPRRPHELKSAELPTTSLLEHLDWPDDCRVTSRNRCDLDGSRPPSRPRHTFRRTSTYIQQHFGNLDLLLNLLNATSF